MSNDVKEIKVEEFYGNGSDLILTSRGNILKEVTRNGLRVAKPADGGTIAKLMFRLIESLEEYNVKEKLSNLNSDSKF